MAREGEKEDKGPPTWATLAMGATSGNAERISLHLCTSHFEQRFTSDQPRASKISQSDAQNHAAGAISRLLTYPADTIKARVQVQGSSPSLTTYSGVFNATGTILRQEGFRGLFRGIGPVLAGAMPGSMAYYWVRAAVVAGCGHALSRAQRLIASCECAASPAMSISIR